MREAFVGGATTPTGQALVGERGQYHFDSNTAFAIKLTNRFSLNTGVIDLYLSNPAPGSQRNNLALTTRIAATF